MKTTHVTKEGDKLLIVEMADDHLISTINLFCKQVKQYREALDNPKEFKKSEEYLYGKDKIGENEAGNRLVSLTDKLSVYVFEASIRGLDVAKMLQEAYGRKELKEINPKIDF